MTLRPSAAYITINLVWDPVPNSTSYDILKNGKKVATAGASVASTRISVSNKDLIAIVAQPSKKEQDLILSWMSTDVIPPTPVPVPTPSTERWFPDTAWPNLLIPNNPAIDQQSPKWMQMIKAACPQGIYPNGVNANGSNSVPVYHANASTPTKGVSTPYQGTIVIPYVKGWTPASPGDNHFTVVRDDTGWICEFQDFQIAADGSLSAHMFAQWNIHTSDVVPVAGNSVSILPTVGGLILASEVAVYASNGTIPPHAIRFAAPIGAPANDRTSPVRWPAFQSDGRTVGGLPSGARLWLPRSVSLSGLDKFQTMMARMCQEYGAYHGDSNGSTPALSTFVEAVNDGCSYPFAVTTLPFSILSQMVVLA